MANSVKDPILVSIIGGSGYTGAELIRLVSKHPHFQLNQVVANRNAGKKIQDIICELRPELINNKLYFFESSLAPVLFPLAASPSQATISFLYFFT